MLSLSSIADDSDTKADANELVNVADKDETNLLKSYELKAVKMDVDIKGKNEPPTGILVEIDMKDEERGGVTFVPSPPPVIKIPVVPPTGILVNINDTLPATNKIVDKITNEAVAESPVINETPGKIVNKTIVKETPDKITNNVVVNELNINMFPALMSESDNEHVKDEQLNSASVVQLGTDLGSPVQQLRRSKRLSRQINADELVAEPLLKQKKQVDKPISVEKPTSDSQDEAPTQSVVLDTPESKPVRRSSRRISVVSTGYKRQSSRRSSHQPGYFRKPVTMKQIEVHLHDVGINEVVIKSEPSATPELHKAVCSGSEHSSAESEDDAVSSIPRSNIPHQSAKTDSSSDEPSEGTVAGIIQKFNKKNEQTSLFKTPNGIRKIKRIGSGVQGSSHQKPANLVGGSVKSFIKRQSVKKLDANEVARQKKLDLQRKEEKDRERKDQAELRRKNWADQQKRKREEKQKRVAEAKAARAREEQDKKERQLEDKRQMVYASEQARKKREHEEETKKRLREQRTKEAEARRLKETEERLKRLQEKKEDDKIYREMMKRKQEQEEQDRKQRIQDEKRAHEQKQRERAREKEEERERRLREIKEREAKRLEKEEAERKEREEKERKQRLILDSFYCILNIFPRFLRTS
ncbi:Hypothetical predicted protein [Paramuricea clavata]|uniref:Uncharacterized protein n=1 Tax=Paramuricea clavata TaxID=317549 RepID=A0A6S7L1V2_PARCT|nr:Hypothetical predicted protein [Paramuricea clavata]